MAKNYELIPGERRNWEVAIFLLIDHLYPGIGVGMPISRTNLTSSLKAIEFIESKLGKIGYEVNKTLENSISSTITRAMQDNYIDCSDGDCFLTKKGIARLKEIIFKSASAKQAPVGKTKDITDTLNSLSEKQLNELVNSLSEEDRQAFLKGLMKS